jgi:hypothetical protein
MKQLLQEYLVEYQTLPLPRIGVLQAVPQPAVYDIAERTFQAPDVQINFKPFQEGESSPIQHLVGFISVKKNIPEEEAFKMLEQYCSDAVNQLESSSKLPWSPLGIFETIDAKNIAFKANEITSGFSPLTSDRVIRAGASHEMLVGDTSTTNIEMEAFLAETEEATDRWWLLPLLLALGAIALIIWQKVTS